MKLTEILFPHTNGNAFNLMVVIQLFFIYFILTIKYLAHHMGSKLHAVGTNFYLVMVLVL